MVKKAKQLLFAPLDWGMGHTTRSIPIIKHLQSLGHQVTFAGNSAQCALIKRNIDIEAIHLNGYNITYSKKGNTFSLHLLAQVPRILRAIKQEHRWLKQLLATRQYDGVISDNRYGLYCNNVPTVIITHQLCIQTGMGRIADGMLQRLHYKLLNRFGERWIADNPGEPNLASALSHPTTISASTHYIGLLSQLNKPGETVTADETLLILLSGPEPQRTILASILWLQAVHHEGPVVFVEGHTGTMPPATVPQHIAWYAQLAQTELQPIMQQAAMVICRSGYSTLMDLVLLRKKAILIPTPGQPEQEYLARYLHGKKYFYSAPQKNFNLSRAVANATQLSHVYTGMDDAFDHFKPVINKWLTTL